MELQPAPIAPPPALDTPLIFFDIDGVLNNHILHPDFNRLRIDAPQTAIFNSILQQTGAYIVMVSAWRYMIHNGDMTLEGMRDLLLSHWVDARRLCGYTRRDLADGRSDRGPQIHEYRAAYNHVGKYCAIDDGLFDYRENGIPLFTPNGCVGLTPQLEKEIVAYFHS